MHTNRVFGTVKCVLYIEVSSFQGVLIREVALYGTAVDIQCTTSEGEE